MACGLAYADFWDVSPREAQIITKAAQERDMRLIMLMANSNAFAFHDPKNIPELPETKPKEMSEDMKKADAIAAREIMKAWAARSGGS